ncbi:MAG: MFS transporter, partial [Bordetella sp.]|nr:MFS transporter [Bordetella sp.]
MSTTTQYPGPAQPHPGHPGAKPSLGASHAKVAPSEIAVGVVIGRTSEYFDFFVFGIACVMVFPRVFFPFEAPLEGTLWSFAVFALAFVVRPLGTAISMAIQRRWGRGIKLTVALFLLGTATCGIAFLPRYESIGAYAIILLAVFRGLQGMALGGSWDGLPSLLALNAPSSRRGWYAMIGQLGAPIGFMIASALFLFLHLTLTDADFIDWGWRYPFFVAFAINVVALFARLRLVVTEEYTALLEEGELEPIATGEIVREQGYNMFIGAFAALASYALFHLVTVFPLSWIVLGKTQTINAVLSIQLVGGGV